MARSPAPLWTVPGAHLGCCYGVDQRAAEPWERRRSAKESAKESDNDSVGDNVGDNERRQNEFHPRSEPRVGAPTSVVAAKPDARAACAARRWPPPRRRGWFRRAGPLTPAAREWSVAHCILLA